MDLKLENYNSESEINIIEFIFKYEKKKKTHFNCCLKPQTISICRAGKGQGRQLPPLFTQKIMIKNYVYLKTLLPPQL